MKTAILVRLFTAITLAAFATGAQAADWTVKKTFGQAWMQSRGAQKISLTRGADLKGKTTIITGKNGKVVLARDTESMIVGPNATVIIPGRNMFGRTTIRQNAGTVVYDVEKRNVRHFAVQTPTLTAVVKGTKFEVQAKDKVSRVSVQQGSVRVSDRSTGDSEDLSPGQEATVDRGFGKGLVVATNASSGSSAGNEGGDSGSSGEANGNGKANGNGEAKGKGQKKGYGGN